MLNKYVLCMNEKDIKRMSYPIAEQNLAVMNVP